VVRKSAAALVYTAIQEPLGAEGSVGTTVTALMTPEESSPESTRSITMLNVYAGLV
jgi:hypothetical protein